MARMDLYVTDTCPRDATDADIGFLRGKRYLNLARGGKYSDAFRSALVREEPS